MYKFFTSVIACLLILSFSCLQAQVAFPGAEGAGRFATGGRGTAAVPTTIYEVTNLGDVNAPGSLRYAVTNNAAVLHRTIIFRISGTIRLTSPLVISRANTTIAGQTAPGDGICIADYPVSIGANNVIVRYIRFRMGDKAGTAASDYDALGARGRKHVIIDHCSVSWGVDETLSFYENDSCTVQYTIISEPLNLSYHDEGSGFQVHGYGGIWGGKLVSFHHNLLAHCQGRMPRFDGIRNVPDENADYRNNVLYNWGDYTVNGGEGGKYNVVNNYYKYGPNTPDNRKTRLLNPYRTPPLPYGTFYMTGNYVDGSTLVTNNNWSGAVMNGGTAADTVLAKALVPFPIVPITSYTALEAYQQVITGVGAVLPKRDTLDQRIISNVINRTGSLINVQGGYPAYTPYAVSSLTAWPTLTSTTALADTDVDGMPDAWESRRGLNPASAADRQGTTANGYTNLENFLNGDSIVAGGVLNTCVTGKSISRNVTGPANWIDVKDTTYTSLIPTDSLNLIASIKNEGDFTSATVGYYVTNTTRFDNSRAYLNRNINVSITGAVSMPVTIRMYISAAEYNALQSADNSITSISSLRIVRVANSTCLSALPASGQTVIQPTTSGVFGTYGNGYFIEFSTSIGGNFFVMSANSAPLPLTLISFSANLVSSKVNVSWKVENMINVSHFVIERSANGQNFSEVGRVNLNTNVAPNLYNFVDAEALKGVSYYRLKIVDNDGKFAYSAIVSVSNKSISLLTLKPNPVVTNVTVVHPVSASSASLYVYSAEGKKVYEQKVISSTSSTMLNMSSLSKGYYELIYINGDSKLSTSFLKK